MRRGFGLMSAVALAAGLTATGCDVLASGNVEPRVGELRVVPEHSRSGYDRDLFAEYDRDVILARNFARFPACDGYYSRFDGECYPVGSGTSTEEADDNVDIDHVVALVEAWESGAYRWDAAERNRFSTDRRNLTVLTRSVNRGAKSGRDATGWVPSEDRCRFVSVVVRVKIDYGLAADRAEADRLRELVAGCD